MRHARVPTERLLDLARRGMTQDRIAEAVGMSRQGVNYRLLVAGRRRYAPREDIGIARPRPLPPLPYPRAEVEAAKRCQPCGRSLQGATKMADRSILPDGAWCRWCARPLTDAAKAACPLDGFLAMARRNGRTSASAKRPTAREPE